MDIKSIEVVSLARYDSTMTGMIGLLIGFVYGFFWIVSGFMQGEIVLGLMRGTLAIILTPMAYALFGFICGASGAWAYNLSRKGSERFD